MTYPKKLMTISELKALGFPRSYLYQVCHHRLRSKYLITTPRGGKFYVDTEEFEKVKHLIR